MGCGRGSGGCRGRACRGGWLVAVVVVVVVVVAVVVRVWVYAHEGFRLWGCWGRPGY